MVKRTPGVRYSLQARDQRSIRLNGVGSIDSFETLILKRDKMRSVKKRATKRGREDAGGGSFASIELRLSDLGQ